MPPCPQRQERERGRGDDRHDRQEPLLHDVSIADEQSTGGRFCKIGEYVLELDGSSLTGSYESQDCQDAGRVELTRSP